MSRRRAASTAASAIVAAFLAAAAVAALPAPAHGEETAPVTLKSDIEIEGDVVTLGDLFAGLGDKAGEAIANAPAPGEQVRLNASWLARVAKAYQVDWRPRSPSVTTTVRRASQRLGSTRIREAIRAALDRRGLAENLSITLDNPRLSLVLPVTAPATVAVANLSYDRSNGRFSANVVAPDVDTPQASATVTGRGVRMREVPVPAQRIGRGEIIRADDLEWVEMPAGKLNRNHLTAADDIVGKSARRAARPGEPLRAGDVRKPVVVAKNSLVTITLQTERMRLTAQGRALEDAAKGETVRVVNTNSKATVTGVATAADTVSVKP